MLLNLIGNCVVFLVFLKNRSLRKPVNYLLLNLAIVDLLVGVTAIPSHIVSPFYSSSREIGGEIICKLVTSDNLTYICGHVSAFTLTVIAYERFQAVVHPHTVKEKITTRRIFIFLVLCWTISLATIGPWVYWAKVNQKSGQCYEGDPPSYAAALYRYINIGVFGVPLVVMALLYGRVIRKLTNSERQELRRAFQAVAKTRTRVTWMLFSVTLVYAICWSPITAFFAVTDYGHEHILYRIFTLFIVLNSSLNAFLYTLFSNQFRQGVRNVFGLSWRSLKVPSMNSKDQN